MKRWILFAVTLGLLAAGLAASQKNQVEARFGPDALHYFLADTQRELTRLPAKYTAISDDEEIKIGNQIAQQIEHEGQDEEGKAVEAYLRLVGNRVAAKAHRKLPYKFHYIPERSFINAFAIPGGHVFMGAGLMDLMESEDELAAVLGHEIEHIDHKHCIERVQFERAMRKIPLAEVFVIPAEVYQEGYSKDQEAEADSEGTALSVAAGYSPQGAVDLFQHFQKLEEQYFGKNRRAANPEEEASGAVIQVLSDYFLTHPPTGDRIALIQKLIADQGWKPAPEKPLAVRYFFLAHQAEEQLAAAKYDKAIQTASEALQLHPGHPPALVALAKAACAKQDFPKAAAAYRELLASRQPAADSVRAFADQLGNNAMASRRFADAGRFVAFSLELQPNNASSLKLLAEVKLELNDAGAAVEIGQKLQKLYPQSAADLAEYASNASDRAFQAHDYTRAAFFAGYSLRLEPKQPTMKSQLAASEFALADFRSAADTYGKIINNVLHDKDTLTPELLDNYSDSLGSAARHGDAAKEFRTTVGIGTNLNGDLATQVKIEQAGLEIMAGNDSAALTLTGPNVSFAPERAARLGWWYYRAGKFDEADQLLRRYWSQRPGDGGLQITMGWVELEQNKPADALPRFGVYANDERAAASASAGRAIAQWRLQQKDAAMRTFEQLSKEAPEWTNPTWVRALYGPVAAQSAQEMNTELARRIAARKH
ncbi:MAG TPA: M48 family metalloprotease [Candidatus Angelobacter sp.]|nr:M48 family metalloprotease [Candidatus Angelobacter sp.]